MDRQLVFPQHGVDTPGGFSIAPAHPHGTTGNDAQPGGYGVTMRQGVAAAFFDGMAEGMPQIEQLALAIFLFIAHDHGSLVSDTVGDDFAQAD